MSVFIYEPDAFAKICQVEGPEYLKNQKNFRNRSFAAFKKHWDRMIARNPELKELGKDCTISVAGNPAIYGWWGWNRYLVYYSGEIVFLDDLAINSEATKRAREIGFTIFSERCKK
jgi:hypothetical protein